ncbi:acyl-[acyl-carrier-protein] thioesterase [Ruminococcus albus]|uniref:Acyl-ACP thioesterase n=1 Tax=Ruminococcus albus TaxID=1264 RepID=A0A1I1FW89_RUMAL|nr:acyl-ACP thioesterase domain-containing protein [Ruminococcus albus]SFC03717.1 Acyl-ACP thioesterase [Ruminococcus albus]
MFETERMIYCSQIGEGGKVRNSGLVDILQDTSDLHLMNHPVLAPFFKETGSVMFLTHRQVDIIRRPEYGEHISTKTWTYELNRMYGSRNTIVLGEKGDVCIKSIAGGAFMDIRTGRPIRVSADLIAQVKSYEKLEMEYLPRKIAVPDTDPVITCQMVIRRSDIDMNDHVNNARYFDITDELFHECYNAKRLRAEYKFPIKRGDAVFADRYDTTSGCIISLRDDSGKVFCNVEYTL